jgi:cytochrome c biogenesis protein CcmG/thiol:disulfide interchange protein DsbE
MKRSLFKWLVVLNLCLVWAFFLPHCAKKEKDATGAPDFTLKTLDDKEITLSKLKGKVVLLDFWATWCGPCRESVPHLVQLYKTYQKNGLELIGMNMDRGNIDAVRRFVKSMDIPYPITVTPDDVERNYGITGLPTTILIDKEGKIRQRFIGFTNEMAKQMTALVTELTSEKP